MVSMFAGANTPYGFVSRFDHIQNEEDNCRKIYIKGGSGMGKSTIMKRIAAHAEENGYDTELFYCSSDVNSLDGINIKELGVAVVDATPPHTADPIYPGVCGEIFNTADYLDYEKVKPYDQQIRLFTDKKKKNYQIGYNYLKAALPLLQTASERYGEYMDKRAVNIESSKIINRLFSGIRTVREGKMRKLFLSAISPDGVVSFADSVFEGINVITVKGMYGADAFMKKIANAALAAGLDITVFCCPMMPLDKYEHIVIPKMKTAFTTYNAYHHYAGDEIIDMDKYLLKEAQPDFDNPSQAADQMIQNAVSFFEKAKAAHGFLESFYSGAMDFAALDDAAKKLEDKIFV